MAHRITTARPRTAPTLEPAPPLSYWATLSLVRGYWAETGALSDQTSLRMFETVRRFASRLDAAGVGSFAEATPAHASAFIDARRQGGKAPELTTRHARRTALRALYRALRGLGLCSGDPTLDIWLPPRGDLAARPLTDDEVALARISAQVLPRVATTAVRATAWALGETTAVSSEITAVRIADLNSTDRPSRVRLPGTRRHDPREVELTAWGQRVVALRVAQLLDTGAGPDTLLAYGGAAPAGGAKAQASVCNALRDTLAAAGLRAEPDVRPSSLRHWAGRRAYDSGAPIEQVALLLGHRSLDETATDIGLHWRQRISPSGPGGVR